MTWGGFGGGVDASGSNERTRTPRMSSPRSSQSQRTSSSSGSFRSGSERRYLARCSRCVARTRVGRCARRDGDGGFDGADTMEVWGLVARFAKRRRHGVRSTR